MKLFWRIAAAVPIIAATVHGAGLHAQSIAGPLLGFVATDAGGSIQPILGVPGASALGSRVALDAPIRAAIISPKHDYALAIRATDAQVVLIDLTSLSSMLRSIGSGIPGDAIAISPSGSSAAVYERESRTVRVIGGLPTSPNVVRQFDASRITGELSGLGVSDDGVLAFGKFIPEADDNPALWVLDGSSTPWRAPADRPSTASFLVNRRDLLIADDATRSVFLILDIGGSYARSPIVSAPGDAGEFTGVAASDDAGRVIAATTSGAILFVNAANLAMTAVPCGCRPAALRPLKGDMVLQLSDPSAGEPIWILDATTAPLRIVLTPPGGSQ